MRWGRAIAGGVLAEALLMVAVIPGFALGNESLVVWIAVIGSLVTAFLGALWVCRRLDSRFVQHGVVVGVTAMVVYMAIVVATGSVAAMPAIYWVAHGLKLAGGALGGLVAARRVTNAAVARVGA